MEEKKKKFGKVAQIFKLSPSIFKRTHGTILTTTTTFKNDLLRRKLHAG